MKKIIIFLCILMLGGCTAKFAYNNASWLVYWYLDDYLELNNEQEDMFDSMLERWLIWHRENELSQYQRQLEDIIGDIKLNNINEQSITTHRDRARLHWERVRAHIAPDIVTLAGTLSPNQIVYLFASLEKENKEDEEELGETSELSEQEKIEKWTKRNQKGIKKWIGKLTKEQNILIASYFGKFESTKQHWIAYKREYQQQLRDVFASPERDEIFEQKLLALIIKPEKFRSSTFQKLMDENAKAGSEFMMGVFTLMSDKQRNNLVDEINEFKQDTIQLQK